MALPTRGIIGTMPTLPRPRLRWMAEECIDAARPSRSFSVHASSSSRPTQHIHSNASSTSSLLARHSTLSIRARPTSSPSHQSIRALSIWPIWKRTADPRAGEGALEGENAVETAGGMGAHVNGPVGRPLVENGTVFGSGNVDQGRAFGTVGPDVEVASASSNLGASTNVANASSGNAFGNTASTTDSTPLPGADATPLFPQPPALPTSPTLDELIASNPDNIAEVLASPEAIHAVMRIGDLRSMGLEKGMLNPVGWVQSVLEGMHVYTGMPWWATIAAFTIIIRLFLLPLVIKGQKNNVRMAAIQPQTQALTAKMSEAKSIGDTVAMSVYSRQLQTLFKENDCGPFRSLMLPLVQVPIFLTFFFAVRGLATLPVPQLKEGGLWWFEDLTMADPYYILPVVSMALQLAVLEVGADGTGGAAGQTRQTQHFKNVFRFMIVLAIPFIGRIASAMTFYWTFTNAFTLIQASLLKRPLIRNMLSIPTPLRAPLPQGVKPQPPPTLMETIREGRAYFRKTSTEAATKAAERAQARRTGGTRGSTASRPIPAAVRNNPSLEMSEVILEDASVTPGPRPTAATSPVLKAVARQKSEKEQRIAAARARREKQS